MSISLLASVFVFVLLLSGLGCCPNGEAGTETTFGVGVWSRELGNQRALVEVSSEALTGASDAVRVLIPWRRIDPRPETKQIIVFAVASHERVQNVVRVRIESESGDLAFQPTTGAGVYEVYYMPCKHTGPPHKIATEYTPTDDTTVDPSWRQRNQLTSEDLLTGLWQSLPEAKTTSIQARSEFDRRDPMAIPATAEETQKLLSQYPNRQYLVFPEHRAFPIQLTDALPQRWIESGPKTEITAEVPRGLFYTFQIGLYAPKTPLEEVQVEFGGIENLVSADAFRCFNLGGVDWLGKPFEKKVSVETGKVKALWCGVQIPKDASPGRYSGVLTVHPANAEPTAIPISLDVLPSVMEDGGDGELWQMSRLRWLDSTIGLDDDVVAPYTPLEVDGKTVSCLGRKVRFADTALPESIKAGDTEILDAPIRFTIETANGFFYGVGGGASLAYQAQGAVVFESSGEVGAVKITTEARMEFDGYINFRVTLEPRTTLNAKDLYLEIPIRREVATYMMGLGRKGGFRPSEWQWKWDINLANNSVWIGDVTAGLQCKLKGLQDTWDLYGFGKAGFPQPWENKGNGGCRIVERGPNQVLIQAYTGPKEIPAGEKTHFRFGLLITPVKPLDPRHWNWRYQHQYKGLPEPGPDSPNIINIHHGNELNPYINYPFLHSDKLGAFVEEAHKRNIKVKLYYTVRELSNHTAEIWALRSLGTEVFADGPGGGYSWLQERLLTNYFPAWHELELPNGDMDGAILTTGLSRWHNYYLEGLAWLLKNVELDGLYLDGIGYDRVIMQRVLKVMQRTRPGSLIDFHSGNNFHPEYGLNSCANQYMEHFPYVDSLWFGEGFDYNESPDYWLVEVSGIPFGLFGEMLHEGGNPWRGMVYGMTSRLGWGGDPRPLWRLWDQFGIADAKMVGYWDKSCPVRSDNQDILATAYCRKGSMLLSLASWAKEKSSCQLDVDWNAVGLDPQKVRFHAPKIEGFQEERTFAKGEPIEIDPGRGWLILVE